MGLNNWIIQLIYSDYYDDYSDNSATVRGLSPLSNLKYPALYAIFDDI